MRREFLLVFFGSDAAFGLLHVHSRGGPLAFFPGVPATPHMQPGQSVALRADAFPGLRRWDMSTACRLAPAQTSLRCRRKTPPAFFVRVVQRVPVRILPDDPLTRLVDISWDVGRGHSDHQPSSALAGAFALTSAY
jgi:hypothetical protein